MGLLVGLFIERCLVVNTNVARDPWNRNRPVATSTQYRQDGAPGERFPILLSGPTPGPLFLFILFPLTAILETFSSSFPYLVRPVPIPVLLSYKLRFTVLTWSGLDYIHAPSMLG